MLEGCLATCLNTIDIDQVLRVAHHIIDKGEGCQPLVEKGSGCKGWGIQYVHPPEQGAGTDVHLDVTPPTPTPKAFFFLGFTRTGERRPPTIQPTVPSRQLVSGGGICTYMCPKSEERLLLFVPRSTRRALWAGPRVVFSSCVCVCVCHAGVGGEIFRRKMLIYLMRAAVSIMHRGSEAAVYCGRRSLSGSRWRPNCEGVRLARGM
jgi:hypothetical protein